MDMKWHTIVNGDTSRVQRDEELLFTVFDEDEDSDCLFECELLERDVPPNGKPEDCPLNR